MMRILNRLAVVVSLIAVLNTGCRTGTAPGTMPEAPESTALEAFAAQSKPLAERAEPVNPPASGGTEALMLSRDGALLTALMNNRAIEVAELGPEIAGTYVPEARAAFDPGILGAVSFGRVTDPPATISPSTTSSTTSSTSSGAQTTTAMLTQSLATFERLRDQWNAGRSDGTDQDTAEGAVSIEQPLPTGTLVYLTGSASDTDTEGKARDYEGNWEFGVRQALLEGAGTGPNLAALRQARNEVLRSREQFRGDVIEITRQVELAYWDLVLAIEVLKIREFAVTLADEQMRLNEAWVKVGKAIEGDVIAAQAEKSSRMADLSDAQAGVAKCNIALVRLLNPRADQPWAVTFAPADPPEVAEVSVSPDESESFAAVCRPELAEARYELANAGLDEVQTRNALLPRLDLVGAYGRTSQGTSSRGIGRHLDDSAYEGYSVGLEFETPLLNRAEKARHRRSQLLAERSARSLAELEQAVAADVRQAVVEAQKQWQRIAPTQDAMRSREEQLRVAKGRNAVGKTTNLDLLYVQRDYIQAQVNEVTARTAYIQSLTDLYAAEGTLAARRGISFGEAVGGDQDE